LFALLMPEHHQALAVERVKPPMIDHVVGEERSPCNSVEDR